jgi:hypothetical protein
MTREGTDNRHMASVANHQNARLALASEKPGWDMAGS